MSNLRTYINSAEWQHYYPEYPESHALNFLYAVIGCVERDGADELSKTPHAFIWSKNNTVIGTFPLVVESTPPFHTLLLEILKRDVVIQQFLRVDAADDMRFYVIPQTIAIETLLSEKS
jgi:hypothetical protein